MRSDGFSKLWANYLTRTLCSWTTGEQHDSTASILEGGLEQADGDAQCDSCASDRSLVIGHRPRVFLQLLQRVCELKLTLLYGKEKSGGWPHCWWSARLRGHVGSHASRWRQAQHLLNLFGRIIFAATEDIRLGTLRVAKFMDLRLGFVSLNVPHLSSVAVTIVPKVMRPTRAFGGSRLKLVTKETFKAFRLSSSWHVSTT